MTRSEVIAAGLFKTTFSTDNNQELASVTRHLDILTNQWITNVTVVAPHPGISIDQTRELIQAMQTIVTEHDVKGAT